MERPALLDKPLNPLTATQQPISGDGPQGGLTDVFIRPKIAISERELSSWISEGDTGTIMKEQPRTIVCPGNLAYTTPDNYSKNLAHNPLVCTCSIAVIGHTDIISAGDATKSLSNTYSHFNFKSIPTGSWVVWPPTNRNRNERLLLTSTILMRYIDRQNDSTDRFQQRVDDVASGKSTGQPTEDERKKLNEESKKFLHNPILNPTFREFKKDENVIPHTTNGYREYPNSKSIVYDENFRFQYPSNFEYMKKFNCCIVTFIDIIDEDRRKYPVLRDNPSVKGLFKCSGFFNGKEEASEYYKTVIHPRYKKSISHKVMGLCGFASYPPQRSFCQEITANPKKVNEVFMKEFYEGQKATDEDTKAFGIDTEFDNSRAGKIAQFNYKLKEIEELRNLLKSEMSDEEFNITMRSLESIDRVNESNGMEDDISRFDSHIQRLKMLKDELSSVSVIPVTTEHWKNKEGVQPISYKDSIGITKEHEQAYRTLTTEDLADFVVNNMNDVVDTDMN